MKALSIIGILLSIGGILVSLFIMSEARCHCYCNDDYLFSSGKVPDEATGGALMTLIAFIFFLIFSIVSTAVSFGKKNAANNLASQPIPPFQPQAQPFQQQPFQNYPPYQTQYPQNNPYPPQNNPYPPNPFRQSPYQQPQQPQNPFPPQPPQNPYQPPQNPDPNANNNTPPNNDTPPPPQNPWAPKG